MKVHSLHIYPVKGMRGISLKSAALKPEGFEYDRRWMLVDESGKFISQRTHREMTMFVPSIKDDFLSIVHKGDEIKIAIDDLSGGDIDVTVWSDDMSATVVSDESSRWFSERLGTPLRLVRVSKVTNRITDFSKYVDSVVTDTAVSFADEYPYLILSTASMAHLNSKMDIDLGIDRFRANIIVDTDSPHEEDTWKSIKIGDQRMRVIKPCARCKVPTIDQQTGVQGKQPNKALAKYRVVDKKVIFGMNAIALTGGILNVGDDIVVD